MSVTLAIRFPLGRYHATPWDRSVNEGVVEWPPAPWRLLRTLVATWYHRWPDLPAPVLDGLLAVLGDPPSYRTVGGHAAHTRHYLPDANRRTGETGNTDLALDPFLSLPTTGDHLLVHWEADLTAEQREVLTKLTELVPYLGRAESVCDIRVLDDAAQPDDTWWRPGASGDETVRLLAAAQPVSRPAIELSTIDVRKMRRTLPPHTVWVDYGRVQDEHRVAPKHHQQVSVAAVRLAVESQAPFRATHGVLLADHLHRRVTARLDGGRRELLGHAGATTDHAHAHWIALPTNAERGAQVRTVIVWAPSGMSPEEVNAILNIGKLSGHRAGPDSYEVKGFPDTQLLLEAAGEIAQVAPELCGPARVWQSITPYLPVRHQKRSTLDDHLVADVTRELAYRGRPAPAAVTRLYPDGQADRWAVEFRRYRLRECARDARRGFGLRVQFAQPITGPLLLGQLSHFGYGIFVPDPAAGP